MGQTGDQVCSGLKVFGPASGSQACGDVGFGRMLEASDLVHCAAECFQHLALTGKHVLITAGPTQENIDPVRYITNHSSGKMGFALAEAAVEAGARVTLITGPVHLPTPDRVSRIDVVSARDMLAACEAAIPCDVFIASAAVADYRPEVVAPQKLKKDPTKGDGLLLQMVRNPDILATIATRPDRPFSVGFAAETEHLLDYAARKLKDKNLDLIVANDVANPSIGFNSEENACSVIDRDLHATVFAQTSKSKIARQLITFIADANTDGPWVIRLVSGKDSLATRFGRVELQPGKNAMWGTVCSVEAQDAPAQTVPKALIGLHRRVSFLQAMQTRIPLLLQLAAGAVRLSMHSCLGLVLSLGAMISHRAQG